MSPGPGRATLCCCPPQQLHLMLRRSASAKLTWPLGECSLNSVTPRRTVLTRECGEPCPPRSTYTYTRMAVLRDSHEGGSQTHDAVPQSGETSVIIKANLKSHIVQECSVISPLSPESPLPSRVPLQSWLCVGAVTRAPLQTSSGSQLTSLPHRRCNIRWLAASMPRYGTRARYAEMQSVNGPRYVEVRCHRPARAASEHRPGPEKLTGADSTSLLSETIQNKAHCHTPSSNYVFFKHVNLSVHFLFVTL